MIGLDAFDPNSAVVDGRRELLSPSGKYKLVVIPLKTRRGGWDHSQGTVYRKGDDRPVAEVRRNYGVFPSLFVEGHPNGHDYLVCGEDYQGQTVVELDTGARRSVLSDGAKDGFGFCWSGHRYDAASGMLIVDGCHWACPYEVRFYDFSDPMTGWSEIEAGHCIDAGNKEPDVDASGTIRCYSTRYTEDEDDDEGVARAPSEPVVDVVCTYRREGLRLVLTNKWTSDFEKGQQAKRDEATKKAQEWRANFVATDHLYLAYAELVENPALSPEPHMSIGTTHDRWCPDFKGSETRWCRRIVARKGKTGPTVDLEWAVETGPIKLVIFKDGEHVEDRFFGHSAAAMREAFAYAVQLVSA